MAVRIDSDPANVLRAFEQPNIHPHQCARACASTGLCKSWNWVQGLDSCHDHQLNHLQFGNKDGSTAQCILQSTVPGQSAVGLGCNVQSGLSNATLVQLQWQQLQLGSVAPQGWLRDQLVTMANGLSGHLDLFWGDIEHSVWIGGDQDHAGAGHERGPYWLNGMVPLAALLNASGDGSAVPPASTPAAPTTPSRPASIALLTNITAQVNHWISYILDHQNATTGWLGPDDGFGGPGNTYWSGWNVAASLLQMADAMATYDPVLSARCLDAVSRYVVCVYGRMLVTPTQSWSQNRWQDWTHIVHKLMDMLQTTTVQTSSNVTLQTLWDAAELAKLQGWDWNGYYARTGVGANGTGVAGQTIAKFPSRGVSAWTLWDHGVNNAMGTKSGVVWYRQSGDASDAAITQKHLEQQEAAHGQPHGMFSADECFGGRHLNRGIELCAVVEQMFSLEVAFQITGDVSLLDRLERIAYNALPGIITPDVWQHQYLLQSNEINASYNTNPHVWMTDGVQATGFGVAPNFGCCTANMQQGWPKLASNVLLTSPDSSTIAVAILAPASAVTPRGDKVNVTTLYPFGDLVTVTCQPAPGHDLSVAIRVPGWAVQARLSVNNNPPRSVPHGQMVSTPCVPGPDGTATMQLFLDPQITLETGWGDPGATVTNVSFAPQGVHVPANVTADIDTYTFTGGAGQGESKMAGSVDIRSGNPSENTTATPLLAIRGNGHALDTVSFSFRYVAGYTPPAGQTAVASTMTAVLVDSASGAVLATLYESGPLDKYSFDDFTSYSPPIPVSRSGLALPDTEVALQLLFTNNQRNLQILLEPGVGLGLFVSWSGTAKAPSVGGADTPRAVRSAAGPVWPAPTNAAVVVRGPLVFALQLEQQAEVVNTWSPFNNTDVDLSTNTPWNYALAIAYNMTYQTLADPGPQPWSLTNVPAVIQARAALLPAWQEETNAAAEPPASPIMPCTEQPSSPLCTKGTTVPITLVPFGSTNLRVGAMPWTSCTN